jgi:hypothetical protein
MAVSLDIKDVSRMLLVNPSEKVVLLLETVGVLSCDDLVLSSSILLFLPFVYIYIY